MIYLDNAASSKFKPPCVLETVNNILNNPSNTGRSGHKDSIELAMSISRARETVKKFFGATDEHECIFTYNCSTALNYALHGLLDNCDNAHIISTVYEHNSVLRPLYAGARRRSHEITILAPSGNNPVTAQDFIAAINRKTRLIVLNHVSNVTGTVQDVEAICTAARERGIITVVDTAQSAGHTHIDVDAANIDILCFAGHKGLHGPQGSGGMIIRSEIELSPLMQGGTGIDSNSVYQDYMLPEALEIGTLSAHDILGLAAGVKWTSDNFNAVNKRCDFLAAECRYALKQIPRIRIYSAPSSSVISFNVGGIDSSAVADYLDGKDIAVRSGLHCAPYIHNHLGTLAQGAVRASIGYNNSLSDIHTFAAVLEKYTASQKE